MTEQSLESRISNSQQESKAKSNWSLLAYIPAMPVAFATGYAAYEASGVSLMGAIVGTFVGGIIISAGYILPIYPEDKRRQAQYQKYL